MVAVFRLAGHMLHTRWRAWTGLAVIIALAGGAVLAAAAGASRTDSAYQRFLAQSRASDVLVSPAGSIHRESWSAEGCELVIECSPGDELLRS